MARRRNDYRREETRLALVEAAETLFGELGIEGVSLRQIGSAVKSGNTNVVGYYFGKKQDLIEAIYAHRLPGIERRREQLLEAADRLGKGDDIATLMCVLWFPVFEQKNRAGQRSFARFLASMSKSDWRGTRRSLMPAFPVTGELISRIWKAAGRPETERFERRLQLTSVLIASSIDFCEAQEHTRQDDSAAGRIFYDAVVLTAQLLKESDGAGEAALDLLASTAAEPSRT